MPLNSNMLLTFGCIPMIHQQTLFIYFQSLFPMASLYHNMKVSTLYMHTLGFLKSTRCIDSMGSDVQGCYIVYIEYIWKQYKNYMTIFYVDKVCFMLV